MQVSCIQLHLPNGTASPALVGLCVCVRVRVCVYMCVCVRVCVFMCLRVYTCMRARARSISDGVEIIQIISCSLMRGVIITAGVVFSFLLQVLQGKYRWIMTPRLSA
jgi:hypothetical protein